MKESDNRFEMASREWRELLGDEGFLSEERVTPYLANTMGVSRRIPAVLRPRDAAQVGGIVSIAHSHRVPLYPFSTGKNWGYGSTLPIIDDCVLVDLSGLQRIVDMEPETGLVTLEPGVTQRTLRDYLDWEGLPYLVPVTGAGPDCSLVGNALERGYGITPYADHFAAVTAIEAVLPDGRLYRGSLSGLGGVDVDRAFKWGVGPYLDGLFSQGGFGIVTQMTIALAPIPERVEGFFFGLASDADLERAVECVRKALRRVGGVGGSINLMNRRRVLAMMEPYPIGRVGSDGILPDEVVAEMARRNQVRPWMGAGAVYGDRRLVRAARSILRQELRPVARQLVFFTPRRTEQLLGLARLVPGSLGQRARNLFGTLDRTLKLLAGEPSEIALPLAYWRSGERPSGRPMDPAQDGCGLIWYSPLVPMRAGGVRVYCDMVERVCREHGVEPLITLTSLSDRCFDSTVPLLFDPGDRDQADRAKACFEALLSQGMASGFVPYRASVDSMPQFIRAGEPYWDVVRDLKRAIDPHGIIAPGRYTPR